MKSKPVHQSTSTSKNQHTGDVQTKYVINIPYECETEVLKYVDFQTILKSKYVCHRWLQALQNPQIGNRIFFNHFKFLFQKRSIFVSGTSKILENIDREYRENLKIKDYWFSKIRYYSYISSDFSTSTNEMFSDDYFHKKEVNDISWSGGDGNKVATCGNDGQVIVWKLVNDKSSGMFWLDKLHAYRSNFRVYESVSFTSNDEYIIACEYHHGTCLILKNDIDDTESYKASVKGSRLIPKKERKKKKKSKLDFDVDHVKENYKRVLLGQICLVNDELFVDIASYYNNSEQYVFLRELESLNVAGIIQWKLPKHLMIMNFQMYSSNGDDGKKKRKFAVFLLRDYVADCDKMIVKIPYSMYKIALKGKAKNMKKVVIDLCKENCDVVKLILNAKDSKTKYAIKGMLHLSPNGRFLVFCRKIYWEAVVSHRTLEIEEEEICVVDVELMIFLHCYECESTFFTRDIPRIFVNDTFFVVKGSEFDNLEPSIDHYLEDPPDLMICDFLGNVLKEEMFDSSVVCLKFHPKIRRLWCQAKDDGAVALCNKLERKKTLKITQLKKLQ